MRQAKGEKVRHELLPGQSVQLLKELHLVGRDGALQADSLRKLKQVNHLVQLLEPGGRGSDVPLAEDRRDLTQAGTAFAGGEQGPVGGVGTSRRGAPKLAEDVDELLGTHLPRLDGGGRRLQPGQDVGFGDRRAGPGLFVHSP